MTWKRRLTLRAGVPSTGRIALAALATAFLLAGTRVWAQPCVCDPDAGPSFSRVSMLAFAGEFEAIAAGVRAADQGNSPALYKKIARLFRRTEEDLRKGLLARTSLKLEKADRHMQTALKDVEKLSDVMAVAQAGGLLQATPANRLNSRLSDLSADVLGISGPESCWGSCAQGPCRAIDMICGLLAADGCGCYPTSAFPYSVIINPD